MADETEDANLTPIPDELQVVFSVYVVVYSFTGMHKDYTASLILNFLTLFAFYEKVSERLLNLLQQSLVKDYFY